MNKKKLLTSLMSIAMLASITTGATYALFTAEDTANIAITSGKVAVTATVDQTTLKTYSMEVEQPYGTFENGGTATFSDESTLNLNLLTPGDGANFNINVSNNSNVKIKYRIKMDASGELVDALTLKATIDGVDYNFVDSMTSWLDADIGADLPDISVSVLFADALDNNKYQEKSASLRFVVEAVQSNADVVDPITHEEGTRVYYVNSEEGMMLMNGIINRTSHGEGRSLEFYLTDDVDMSGYDWTPIRLHWVAFDGQNHSVSNLNCGIDEWGRSGFAGYTGGGVIKNVTFNNVTSVGSQAGILSGSFDGATLDNVTIAGNNSVTYSYDKNPAETWGGAGAITAVSSYLQAGSNVTIANGATINVDYNGLMTGAPYQNEYAFNEDISSFVTNNGTVTVSGTPLKYVAQGFGKNLNDEYVITSVEGFKYFANSVNSGNKYANETILLETDLDMKDVEFDPIMKFGGTFDGQNKVISNLTIEGENCVALFGEIYGATIKNVVLDGADISGNHYVGGIVGYQTSGTVTGCKVINSKIGAVPNVSGATYDNGDKVGGIVGYLYTGSDSTVKLSNCSVDNVDLYGYRDIGGIVGCADASDVTGCSASNVDIKVDQVTYWYADKDTNADYIVGRVEVGTVDASNTVSGDNNVTVTKAASSDAALDNAINDAFSSGESVDVVLGEGTYTLPSNRSEEANISISGTEDTVIDVTLGAYMDNANISFEGVTIKGSTGKANGNGSDYAALYSYNVEYTKCKFDGGFRVGRDGARFVECTFDLTSNSNTGVEYVWAYGNDVEFVGCTFNTDGKAILLYSDGAGADGISTVVVENCTFNATKGNKAGAIANQNCAAIEIDNYGNGVDLTTSENRYSSHFSGEWRIKSYYTGKKSVTVNGTAYTSLALDGKTMTIDSNKYVTIVD